VWAQIGAEAINSSAHRAVQREAALQSFVLLDNTHSALPLQPGRRVAVLGPQAIARYGLVSDYYNDEVCWTASCQGRQCFDCIPTIAEAIGRANAGGATASAKAVDVNSTDASGIADALALAAAADVVVLALGIDKSIEHEGRDRPNTTLPGLQEPFAQQVLALRKPTVLVLTNGGALAIDTLMGHAAPEVPYAIVEAFNPSVAGTVPLADTLFGKENRWGKLPVTMYPSDFIEQKGMTDYDMASGVGRTYKYFSGVPLFPFGHGLSYTTFELNCTRATPTDATDAAGAAGGAVVRYTFECSVRNTGARDGDEVILAYHALGAGPRAKLNQSTPIRSLVDFARVAVPAGGETRASFSFSPADLATVDTHGRKVVVGGEHQLTFSRGAANLVDDSKFVVAVKPPTASA